MLGSLSRALLFKAGPGETLVVTPNSTTETQDWNLFHLLRIPDWSNLSTLESMSRVFWDLCWWEIILFVFWIPCNSSSRLLNILVGRTGFSECCLMSRGLRALVLGIYWGNVRGSRSEKPSQQMSVFLHFECQWLCCCGGFKVWAYASKHAWAPANCHRP